MSFIRTTVCLAVRIAAVSLWASGCGAMHAAHHGDGHDHGSHEHGAASHGEEHGGKTHAHGEAGHECGMGCGVHEEHVAETAHQEVPQEAPTGGNKFVCALHPNVLSGSPGQCPICGMPLTHAGGVQSVITDEEARAMGVPGITETPAAANPADSLRALAPSEVPADYPLKKCLVSGEAFAGFERVFAFDHEGKTVYLCCPMCLGEFLKTPAKFLKKLEPKAKKN